MKKWEYRWAFVSLEDGKWTMQSGGKTIHNQEIHKYFNSLGEVGWELVNVVSHVGDINPDQGVHMTARLMDTMIAGPRVTTMSQHMPETVGYLFSFKREKEN